MRWWCHTTIQPIFVNRTLYLFLFFFVNEEVNVLFVNLIHVRINHIFRGNYFFLFSFIWKLFFVILNFSAESKNYTMNKYRDQRKRQTLFITPVQRSWRRSLDNPSPKLKNWHFSTSRFIFDRWRQLDMLKKLL